MLETVPKVIQEMYVCIYSGGQKRGTVVST